MLRLTSTTVAQFSRHRSLSVAPPPPPLHTSPVRRSQSPQREMVFCCRFAVCLRFGSVTHSRHNALRPLVAVVCRFGGFLIFGLYSSLISWLVSISCFSCIDRASEEVIVKNANRPADSSGDSVVTTAPRNSSMTLTNFICSLHNSYCYSMTEFLSKILTKFSRSLTDASIKVIAEHCPELCVLDIMNLCKLTDLPIGYLTNTNSCRALHTLKLSRNPFKCLFSLFSEYAFLFNYLFMFCLC